MELPFSRDAGIWYGGSSWDNQAMFDFNGNPLASLRTYSYIQSGTTGFDIVITAVEEPTLNYTTGDTLALPETVTVSFNVGADEEKSVVWNEADEAAVDMNTPGTYVVGGTIEGDVEVQCTVIVKGINLLANPGMENSDMSMYNISQAYARRKTDDPHSGTYSMHFYNSGLVDFTADQTVTLEPGHYEFSLYGQGGDVGGEAVTYAYVKIGDEILTADFALTGWAIWVNPTISFDVTEETSVTMGVSVTASQNGAWGTFDDWYLCEDTTPTHSGGEATCKDPAACEVCGKPYGETDATKHTGGEATCKDQAVCEVCGKSYGETDATKHTGGEATCKDPAVCEVCGKSYGETDATKHTGGTEVRGAVEATTQKEGYTGDTHCLGCGEKLESGKIIPVREATSPPTGDAMPVAFLTVSMIVSLAALAMLLRKRKYF